MRDSSESRETQPIFKAPGVVLALIGCLAGIYGLLFFLGESWQIWSLYALAMIPARFTDAGFPHIPGSQFWSLITYAFLHGGWQHLLFNCIWLLVFGTPVAQFLGPARFLIVAAGSAIGGGLVSLASHWGETMIMVGASGAVSGLLGAAIPIMYGHDLMLAGGQTVRVPLTPTGLISNGRALTFMAVFLGLTLFSGATGWTGNSFMGEGAIAWEAHVGGFVSGIAIFYGLLRSGMRAN